MKHLSYLKNNNIDLPPDFNIRASGQYYTHIEVARHLISALLRSARGHFSEGSTINVVDPFAGDGRLVKWLIESWQASKLPRVKWNITFWDLNPDGHNTAKTSFQQLAASGIELKYKCVTGDTFCLALNHSEAFDIVITNPPWELLKPDRRELKQLGQSMRSAYISKMREYDNFLSENYPDSQPNRKFAGWGTNLSRVGLDVSQSICTPRGLMGVVMPASFMADDQSLRLRRRFLTENKLLDIANFPAEARLFGKADVDTCTLVFKNSKARVVRPKLTQYDKKLVIANSTQIKISSDFLEGSGYILPVSMGAKGIEILQRLIKQCPTWGELESDDTKGLWAGRELDETGSVKWLKKNGQGPPFIRGRMIKRFAILEQPELFVNKPLWKPPASILCERIVWRDISRASQKRRIIATIIPPGYVAGNSLGVAYFRDNNTQALLSMLGVMSSLVFEFQLRCHLATGHVSLSALRKVCIPGRAHLTGIKTLHKAINAALLGEKNAEPHLEAVVAKYVYGISRNDFSSIMDLFQKLTTSEKQHMLFIYDNLQTSTVDMQPSKLRNKDSVDLLPSESYKETDTKVRIPNHKSARLSDLDMQMVLSIPQGGNWKDIPTSIPSKRLDQIRTGFKQGKGSRSTYYGRLRKDMPSYTINTYFNRPGNGCHIHYEQDRVISQREAARLQSFPDNFAFVGPQGAINKQIGNAVPPLLAYQIAKNLGKPGYFIDLFSGAGGLGLGFKWAGWTPVVANDIEKWFLKTYSMKVHNRCIEGSITDGDIFNQVVEIARVARTTAGDTPFWVLGGPPCQGFSTAGNFRSMKDKRNHLFWDYKNFLELIQPDGFVFENVLGLLSMEGGMVINKVKDAFKSVMPTVHDWLLSAEEHAVPQRRKRVILIGTNKSDFALIPPHRLTSCDSSPNLFAELKPAISVEEALSDLPQLLPGQDGSSFNYISEPKTDYQAFMRGLITPEEYLDCIRFNRKGFTVDRHNQPNRPQSRRELVRNDHPPTGRSA